LKNSSYKLLVLDIDGTIIDRDKVVSDEDKQALAKAIDSGLAISLSTGRVPLACLDVIGQLSLNSSYHIFCDGALVSNINHGEEVYVEPIDRDMVKQAVEFAHANDIYFELHSANQYFIEQDTRWADIRRQFFDIQPTITDFNELWNKERIIKGNLIVSNPEELAKFNSFHHRFNDSLSFSWSKTPAYPAIDFINVVARGVSKGNALEVLAAYLGIPIAQVVAIGDGVNDIPLLSIAGLAIAMGNATDEVKAAAHHVTEDIEHNGLAAAINEFLF